MKASRYNKVLGLAIGEKSILAAEVTGGESTEARHLAEFVFPAEISVTDPVALGQALGEFLREQNFSAKNTVIGLPAKWLLVKSKEVPPADDYTTANLLRLQAEGDFSSELRDLVFDYTGKADPKNAGTVLLIATPRRYIDFSNQLCEAAKLDAIAITSTSAALATLSNRGANTSAMVLTLTSAGSELTSQAGGYTNTLRHLRGPVPEPLFINELRRLVSSIATNGSNREMILWDGSGHWTGESASSKGGNGAGARTLGDALGIRVRHGDLPSLGVSTGDDLRNVASNGAGRKYASAVALGMSVLGTQVLPIDFLHSRLAQPKEKLVKPWMMYTTIAAVLAIGLAVFGYLHLQSRQKELAGLTSKLDREKPHKTEAEAFVSKVSFAQQWHGQEPRYMACLNAITALLPVEGYTYCTSLTIKEKEAAPTADKKAPPRNPDDAVPLVVIFRAKAPTNQVALDIKNAFAKDSVHFTELKSEGSGVAGSGVRGSEISFAFTCVYLPDKKKPTK